MLRHISQGHFEHIQYFFYDNLLLTRQLKMPFDSFKSFIILHKSALNFVRTTSFFLSPQVLFFVHFAIIICRSIEYFWAEFMSSASVLYAKIHNAEHNGIWKLFAVYFLFLQMMPLSSSVLLNAITQSNGSDE